MRVMKMSKVENTFVAAQRVKGKGIFFGYGKTMAEAIAQAFQRLTN